MYAVHQKLGLFTSISLRVLKGTGQIVHHVASSVVPHFWGAGDREEVPALASNQCGMGI